jgi:hypothetical protein
MDTHKAAVSAAFAAAFPWLPHTLSAFGAPGAAAQADVDAARSDPRAYLQRLLHRLGGREDPASVVLPPWIQVLNTEGQRGEVERRMRLAQPQRQVARPCSTHGVIWHKLAHCQDV